MTRSLLETHYGATGEDAEARRDELEDALARQKARQETVHTTGSLAVTTLEELASVGELEAMFSASDAEVEPQPSDPVEDPDWQKHASTFED